MSISENKIKFGTDGWRGIIGKDFTFENLGKLASRIAGYLNSSEHGNSICIGYDNRFLSPEYASFFGAVLEQEGLPADLSSKPVSTPCVSHRVKSRGYTLGICVSASHNPSNYNGIKIKENYGGSATEEVVDEITKDLNAIQYSGPTWGLEFAGEKADWEPEYLEEFFKILPEGELTIACDYFHGTAYPCFKDILKAKKYTAISLRSERDPLFGGINPEPKPAYLNELIEVVKSSKADIGFAFDGDGDRIAVVDEKGRYLSSQVVLALMAYDLLDQGKKGSIVKTVAGTYLIDRLAQDFKFDFKVVPIGFKNICPQMINGGVIIAGEESGGIGFGEYLPERDAVYTATRMIEMVIRRGKPLGVLWDEMKDKYGDSVYLRDDYKMPPGANKLEILTKVKENIKNSSFPFKVTDILEIDGIRINMEQGNWLLIRPSGTEPLTRIYAETGNEGLSRKLLEIGKELIS
ncbi:phosphoglucomutase/phosphomannomutase family protein [Elusimicrobiota bacterium]